MPKTWKLTFVINEEARGFSETVYYTSNGEVAPFTLFETIAKARCLLLPKYAVMECYKVGDIEEVGSSYVRTITQTYPNSGLKGEITGDGALFRVEAGEFFRRPYIIRGLPDDWMVRNTTTNRLELNGFGEFTIASYLELLKINGFQLQCEEKISTNPGEDLLVIAAVVGQPQQTALTLSDVLAGGLAGETVVISGCRRTAAKLNGSRVIVGPPSGSTINVRFVYGSVQGFQGSDIANAQVRLSSFTYEAITDYEFIDIRHRKTGKAFFVPRGRR